MPDTIFPKVSVVTPTWHRADLLTKRCIPSVYHQDYLWTGGSIEHVVVTGPDPDLREKLKETIYVPSTYSFKFEEMAENVADGGATPRGIGASIASGHFIAYLDDDNMFRSDHIRRLVDLILEKQVDFVYSQMIRHGVGDVIGAPTPMYGAIDTSLILHHHELLRAGQWQPPGHWGAPDWEIVERWLNSGATWANLADVTVDYYAGVAGGSRE